jgi:hypothetical protein
MIVLAALGLVGLGVATLLPANPLQGAQAGLDAPPTPAGALDAAV